MKGWSLFIMKRTKCGKASSGLLQGGVLADNLNDVRFLLYFVYITHYSFPIK